MADEMLEKVNRLLEHISADKCHCCGESIETAHKVGSLPPGWSVGPTSRRGVPVSGDGGEVRKPVMSDRNSDPIHTDCDKDYLRSDSGC